MLVAELKSFHAVARCGTVTKAAAQLGVSQPTVTGQLRQLESRYGVELFHRQGRGLRLSDAGHRLMPLVEKLVQQESEIEFRLRDASDLREGCLRVGATGPFYIMDTVRRYNQRYPAIELSVAIGNSQSMLQALHDYRIDVATSSVAMNNPNLYRRAIAADPLRIVVHRGHPLAARASAGLADLAPYALLLREPGSMTRQLTEEALQKAGVAPARVLEIGSRESIRQAILCNLGVSLIPSREVPAHAELATVAIADTEVLMQEYLYCLRERQPVQLIARFLELAPSAA
ncbi:aminoethylphosphonate catabolism associated LysR family transcriptional regulator [Bordetella bronchiseptica MBORD675]|uniref:LysR family transcriptional regulator n=1 Tax=Bordetella bronchiseptica TaxID=518 RepID=UPI00030E5382|nr:LysR family transcriptional regulator [Bordetella bronchiseptica]KCV51417.1 aminoethylphosphonate catabolism associated LysR family transcriptional regulator [Bordetella bronchiseptica 7E71]KDC96152.1 aminoethylphosphonate catabolism associated LysR family transcriptional regulator [Bordetella bronchiseptica MBORD675]KDD42889.1 aminoethylphosphonate catabolism associated LysR family transcriptional regulator [Bordetella bronchiseptica MBORD901]RSB99376.1 LysR family transcriptional regulator